MKIYAKQQLNISNTNKTGPLTPSTAASETVTSLADTCPIFPIVFLTASKMHVNLSLHLLVLQNLVRSFCGWFESGESGESGERVRVIKGLISKMYLAYELLGTTSFYYYIIQHPQVNQALSGNYNKEVRYYAEFFNKGTGWYIQQFPPITPLDISFPDDVVPRVHMVHKTTV
jgi:hypothetical protein